MRGRIAAVVSAVTVVLLATVAAAATPPGPPTGVSAVPGDSGATVSWSAPSDDGGDPPSSYTVTSTPLSATCTTSALSCTVPGLANGTSYTFTVTAKNSAGTGPFSAPSAPVTPRTVPGAPRAVRGEPGNARVTLRWAAPGSDGGSPITSYEATANPGGNTCSTPGSSCTVTGLTNGQAYIFTVRATNAAGPGVVSAASPALTPRTTPAPPTGVTVSAGNARVSVNWSAPADTGGAPITRYVVSANPGSRSCTADALTCTVTGLTNGDSYTFTVRAINTVGAGMPSTPSPSTTPRTTPAAPRSPTATVSGQRGAVLAWTAPASTGGAPITGYRATSVPGGLQCTTSALTCTIDGLTPGTRYTFRVVALNTVGEGAPASSPAVSIARLTQSATVRTAKRIRFTGRTVLLKAPVVTNAGQRATARVAVVPGKRLYSRTIRKASGKIILRTKGKRRLAVTLRVTAPATPGYQAYTHQKTWRVRRG